MEHWSLRLFLLVIFTSPYYKDPQEAILKWFPRARRGLKAVMVLYAAIRTCDIILYIHESSRNPSTGQDYFLQLYNPDYCFKAYTRTLEFPVDVMHVIIFVLYLPSFLGTLYKLYRAGVVRTVFREARGSLRSSFRALVPRENTQEWHGRWEKIGQLLEDYFPSVLWEFTPEQLRDPDKMAEYLKEKCSDDSREERLIAMCWALASAYRALLDARQLPRAGEGQKRTKATPTAAGPLPGAVIPAGKTSKSKSARDEKKKGSRKEEEEKRPTVSVATQTAAEPPQGAVPAQKPKGKSVCLVSDEEETEASEEEEETVVITRSPSPAELRVIRKYFQRQLNESPLAWLARCWTFGAHHIHLDGREARQLGCLAWNMSIDKAIGKTAKPLSLWKRLLSGVKERYPTEKDLFVPREKWQDTEEGVQYLRELAVLQVLYEERSRERFPLDPGRAFCTLQTWHRLRASTPAWCSGVFLAVGWSERLTVAKLASHLCRYDPQLSHLAGLWFRPLRILSEVRDYPCVVCEEMLGGDRCELECGHEVHGKCIQTAALHGWGPCPVCYSPAMLAEDNPELPSWAISRKYKALPWSK